MVSTKTLEETFCKKISGRISLQDSELKAIFPSQGTKAFLFLWFKDYYKSCHLRYSFRMVCHKGKSIVYKLINSIKAEIKTYAILCGF